MNKTKTIFLFIIFLIIFALQFTFFIFIAKINNLYKIFEIKNTLHKIILLSGSIEKEIKGFQINNDSFVFAMPSIDINKAFIPDNKDFIIVNHTQSVVLLKLHPSELSIRKSKTIQFSNVKSMKITDRGFINFFCNINGEILESDFFMNKDTNLFPDDFKLF